MKCRSIFAAILLSLVSLNAVSADENGFKSIFDGKSLKGWEGDSEFWSVQDGALTGQTTPEKKLSKNQFLIWTDGETEDFELHIKFRIVNGNSGIQYRSEHLGDYVVKGYQADIDASMRYMGILYEEKGRGILAERGNKVEISAKGDKEVIGSAGDGDALLASIKKEDWNDYVVIAKGNKLTHKINGITSIELVDHQADKRASKGILALQVHQGPPMIVQFKDVKIKQ
jgi:hypothetical protein